MQSLAPLMVGIHVVKFRFLGLPNGAGGCRKEILGSYYIKF